MEISILFFNPIGDAIHCHLTVTVVELVADFPVAAAPVAPVAVITTPAQPVYESSPVIQPTPVEPVFQPRNIGSKILKVREWRE